MRIAIASYISVCAGFLLLMLGVHILHPATPPIEHPYLGEWCIAPIADADLEACYGLDPFIDIEAKHEFDVYDFAIR